MTGSREPASGLEAILDLLREDLLDGRGNDLPTVGLEVLVADEVDLDAAFHGCAGHLVDVAAEAHEEIEWHDHGECTIRKTGGLIKQMKKPPGKAPGAGTGSAIRYYFIAVKL